MCKISPHFGVMFEFDDLKYLRMQIFIPRQTFNAITRLKIGWLKRSVHFQMLTNGSLAKENKTATEMKSSRKLTSSVAQVDLL